jgi:hypothetical protein
VVGHVVQAEEGYAYPPHVLRISTQRARAGKDFIPGDLGD